METEKRKINELNFNKIKKNKSLIKTVFFYF